MADRVVLTPSVLHDCPLDTDAQGGLPDNSATGSRLENCKQLKGLIYGGMNPRASMPMLLSMYRDGHLKLDELVTRRYRDQINEAITDMREGRNIRGIIEFD